MIKVDVLLGMNTLKADWGRGMFKGSDKEFPFISLRKDTIDIKIAITNKQSLEQLKQIIEKLEKNINENSV